MPPIYQGKPTQVSWWPFSPPHERKYKHQERNNKKACQATISEGLDVNWYTHLLDEGKKMPRYGHINIRIYREVGVPIFFI